MDSGAVNAATEVSNVPPGVVLRTSEHLNAPSHDRANHTSDRRQKPAKGRTADSQTTAQVCDGREATKKRHFHHLDGLQDPEERKEMTERQLIQSFPKKIRKYFAQRYRLFHRFDEGIQLDEESWFSVTPEKIAAHIAFRFSHLKGLVDLYSGVGGNSIQFAKIGLHVIAVDIDGEKVAMARNNAKVYGVQDRVENIEGDVFDVLPTLRLRIKDSWGIFLSPPWGGPGYLAKGTFDVSIFRAIVEQAREMSRNVAILVPRNTCRHNISDTFGDCEIEENYLNGKLKTITLYFTNSISHDEV